jgi:hypothetical protein
VFFIEFKAPGKTPTKLQLKTHERIEAQDISVFIIDDIEKGKNLVDSQ